MANNQHSRSGSQLALDLARLAKVIYSIVRAAIAAGLHGAAVADVKEALLFLSYFAKPARLPSLVQIVGRER